MVKKLVAILLAAGTALAVSGETEYANGYTWTYRINGDTAEICGTYYGGALPYFSPAISSYATGAVTIPSTLGGKPLTSIGSSAFSGCSGITSVTIPDSVTSIGWDAFSGCSGLTSVTIPDSVTNIGFSAFYYCSGLTSVTIGNGVTSIGSSAFYNCSGLRSVTIGNGVTSIGDWAFDGCRSLTSVTIPDGVTSIGLDAFYNCIGLTSVTIPGSVVSIGHGAFEGCTRLTSVAIGNGVRSIGWNAFYNCIGLTSVTIPDSVASIENGAFRNCSGLKSLHISDLAAWCRIRFEGWDSNPLSYAHNLYLNGSLVANLAIPYGVTSIGDYTFEGCTSLMRVTIPDSVTSIGAFAFCNCSAINEFSVSAGNIFYKSVSGLLLTKDGKSLIHGVNWNATIPDGVTNIGDGAFSGFCGLTSLMIPDGVTSIGCEAFSCCNGLTSVAIPNGVTSIGESAFYGCNNLKKVTIPDSMTSIGVEAFGGCNDSLYDTTTIHGVVLVDGWAIGSDRDLISGNLDLTGIRGIGGQAFLGCDELTGVTIPNGVTNIGDGAFSECEGLTSVTIPDSVTSIGEEAFADCDSLTSIVFHGNAPSVDYEAFDDVADDCVVLVRRGSTGWGVPIPGTWKGMRIEYFEDDGGIGGDPGSGSGGGVAGGGGGTDAGTAGGGAASGAGGSGSVPAGGGTGSPVGGSSGVAVVSEIAGAVRDTAFVKDQTVRGALFDAEDNFAGVVELKFGKAGKGGVKVSANASVMAGGKEKKLSAKAITLRLTEGERTGALVFKAPIGSMAFSMAEDGKFTLEGGYGKMSEAKVGGNLPNGSMTFGVEIDSEPEFGGDFEVLSDALPAGVELTVSGGKKLDAGKAASPKYKKFKEDGDTWYELVGLDDEAKPNLSGLKLSYTPKTGAFKGSFKVYATNEEGKSPKLKKVTANIVGFVLDFGDGPVGIGQATIKKPTAGPWTVTIR